MTSADRGKYSQKHDAGRPVDDELRKHILDKTEDGRITCSAAFTIAAEENVSPEEVGFVIDMIEARITHCILGLFGYPDGKPVKKAPEKEDTEILDAITAAAVENHLSCKDAWDIADRLKVGRLAVSRLAEAKGIKVNKCQLGAF